MKHSILVAGVALAMVGGCLADTGSEVDNLASKHATFLELSFEGSVVASSTESDAERRKSIVTQLFYMSGELDKSHSAHGQFAFVELTDVVAEPLAADPTLERVSYKAKLPVAWPKYRSVPDSYRIIVPTHTDPNGLRDFNNKYVNKCGHTKYGADSLWYDFKPVSSGCELDEGDVVDTTAAVAPSPNITTDKRPEHERFWDDDVFKAVIVHGTDGASSVESDDDSGVRQYLKFLDKVQAGYPDGEVTKGETNYSIYDDWTYETTIPKFGGGEGKLVVHTLLAGTLKYIGSDFDARFGELTPDADLVMYGGHSGLSKNILAMAAKEQAKERQYQVWFLDGCSTFAYLDRTLVDRRIELNGSELDPNGTKFLDVVVNAQPAPWYTGASSMWNVLSNMADDEKHSYLDILDGLGSSATPLVSGEEDNPSIDE